MKLRSLMGLLLLGCAATAWWRWSPAIPSLTEGPDQGFCLRLPVTVNGHSIQPLMTYRLTARVVASRPYQESGYRSVSPVDLGLVWGASADAKRLAKLTFTQGNRFMNWHWPSAEYAIPSTEIANTHIIPATAEIEARALAIKPGAIIRLRGYLVRVDSEWTSSLTRRDTGDGACEIIYVTDLDIVPEFMAPDSPSRADPVFPSFSTILTENSGDRHIEVVVLAKQGSKIAFARKEDRRLYVLPLGRLSSADQKHFGSLPDGSTPLLQKIEQGLYVRQSDLPSAP
jgi:hypothetical protein